MSAAILPFPRSRDRRFIRRHAGHTFYVEHAPSYGQTFGTLGAVMLLLMWLFLSAFAVLFGAELNAELERQTTHDTTVGAELPVGQRGAAAADGTA